MAEKIKNTEFEIVKEINKEKYLLDYINKNQLPKDVQGFVLRLKKISSVYDDLYRLKWDLEKVQESESTSEEGEGAKVKYFKKFFLALVYLFLIPERNYYKGRALTCLRYTYKNTKSIITDPISQKIIYSTIINLTYKLDPLKKILILVDGRYPFGTETKFKSFDRVYLRKYVTVKWIEKIETPDVAKMLSEYDQLFLFAHGDDEGTELGNIEVTDVWMREQWLNSTKRVKVLGVFSCQEKSWASDIVGLFDYYMTDSESSGANENELFIFISSYIRSWNIVESFRLGRFGPIFRTSTDIGYELYEGGMRVD